MFYGSTLRFDGDKLKTLGAVIQKLLVHRYKIPCLTLGISDGQGGAVSCFRDCAGDRGQIFDHSRYSHTLLVQQGREGGRIQLNELQKFAPNLFDLVGRL